MEKKLLHIGILTRNIKNAVASWAGILNVPAPEIRTITVHTEYLGRPNETELQIAVVSDGIRAAELIQPGGGPSVWADALSVRGEGVHHVALTVEDLEKTLRDGTASGMKLLVRGHSTAGKYAYAEVPEAGTVFEFVEPENRRADDSVR